jgi:hypothetical protein
MTVSIAVEGSMSTVCHRLEFGKFTNGRGTIEGADYCQMAKTAGFPTALEPFASPSQIGPVLRETDARPAWARSHGTVLQPVSLDSTVIAVLARSTELPEGLTSRVYYRTRFAVAAPGVSPLAIVKAFDEAPLTEFTRDDASRLQPLAVERTSWDEVPSAFAVEALRWLLVGRPVFVLEGPTERDFFRLVDSVWWRLPVPVRSWLSAGWGVGHSLRGLLAISVGADPPDDAAVYDAKKQAWTAPQKPVTREASELAAAYLRVAFRGDPTATKPDAFRSHCIERLLESLTPPSSQVLRWNEAGQHAFLQVGRAASDAWRIGKTRDVLSRRSWDGIDPRPILDGLWWKEQAKTACIEVAIAALQRTHTEFAGGVVLGQWWHLSRDSVEEVVRHLSEHEHERVDAFFERAEQAPAAVLNAMRHASADDADTVAGAGDVTALSCGLDAVDHEMLALHAEVLRSPTVPRVYAAFLESWGWKLALAMERAADPNRTAWLTDLGRHAEPPQREWIERLARFATFQGPLPEDIGWPSTQSAFLTDLRGRILARWADRLTPEQRDVVMGWAIDAGLTNHVVFDLGRAIRTGADPKTFDSSQIQGAIRAVTDDTVPLSLEPVLADHASRNLTHFLDTILKMPGCWLRISAHWPESLRRFLGFGGAPARPDDPLPHEIQNLDHAAVEKLVAYWADGAHAAVAQSLHVNYGLIRLVRRSGFRPHAQPTAYVLERLNQAGAAYFADKAVEDAIVPALESAARLCRTFSLDERRGFLPSGRLNIWNQPSTPGFKLLMLLLFPDCDFRVDDQCLIDLGLYRTALARHLDAEGRARYPQLRIAAAEFHALPHNQERAPGPLWAAYRGVPIRLQGRLAEALNHYAGSNAGERLRLCELYLDAQHALELQAAANRIRTDFLMPLAWECGRSGAILLDALDNLGKRPLPYRTQLFDIDSDPRVVLRSHGNFLTAGRPFADFLYKVAALVPQRQGWWR